MEIIKEYWDLILAVLSMASSLVIFIIFFIKRLKSLKNAKTDEERAKIKDEIKSVAYGLITSAEGLFSDIPKSGASKLLYVLNHVKELCVMNEIDYNADEWTEFVNSVVDKSNKVVEGKKFDSAKNDIIEAIKNEIPYFITEVNELFKNIPNALDYKIEHVLKLIATACDKYEINVYNEYDWRAYVMNVFSQEVA